MKCGKVLVRVTLMMLRTFVFHSFLILVLMRSVNGNHRFWGDLIYYKSDHHYQPFQW